MWRFRWRVVLWMLMSWPGGALCEQAHSVLQPMEVAGDQAAGTEADDSKPDDTPADDTPATPADQTEETAPHDTDMVEPRSDDSGADDNTGDDNTGADNTGADDRGKSVLGDVAAESGQTPSAASDGTASVDESRDVASMPEFWVRALVKHVRDSVVLITIDGRDGRHAGLGTGFVVSQDGLIATNFHVIGEGRPITVRFRNGREHRVTEVYASDHTLDLAIIRIDRHDLTPLPLAPADAPVEQGQSIIALGNPMGYRNSVVQGLVSGIQEIEGRPMIQVAIPVERGNSGGPLIERGGHVVGIVTLKSAVTANLAFAVTANDLRTLMDRPNPVPIARWQQIDSLDPNQWEVLFGAHWRRKAGWINVSEMGVGFGGRTLCLSRQPTPEGDLEAGVFVKLGDESGAAGLAFGADGGDRHYGFYPSAGRLRLTYFEGPNVQQWTILDELPSPHYHRGEWNHLKVQLTGDQLTCYVNDQPVIARQLPSRVRGRFGLAKFRDTDASFKHFAISTKIAATRPAEVELQAVQRVIERFQQSAWADESQRQALFATPTASRYQLARRAAELRAEAEQLLQLSKDIHIADVCRQLVASLSGPDDQTDLVRAALLVSALDNPDLDIDSYHAHFDRMVGEIREAIEQGASIQQRLQTLNDYLFSQNGFRGSRTGYYQAANSYFDRLLDDREGLPITLSILYLSLAKRIDLKMEGVGLPGHFLVRHVVEGVEPQLFDVFDRAAPLSTADAARRVVAMTGRPLTAAMLESTSSREMILRVLRNLQGIATQDDDPQASLRYLEAMVSLQPDDVALRGMRAVVRHQTGRKQAALDDLEQIIRAAPPHFDLETVRQLKRRFSQ